MGPGEGIQKQRLLDLPTTIETADQAQQRVSSAASTMRHAPPPPRAPPRPGGLPVYNGLYSCLIFLMKETYVMDMLFF